MQMDKTGSFIKKKRIARKLTQDQLAEHLNVNRNTVSRWERGLNLPDLSILDTLAEELGCTVSEIITGEDITQIKSELNNYDNKTDELNLVLDYSRKERETALTKRKQHLLIALCIGLVVVADLSYGYFSTQLYWQINNREFVPKGIIFSFLFPRLEIINAQGVYLTQMFLIFISVVIVVLLIATSLIITVIKQNGYKNK